MNYSAIAHIHNDYKEKFGIPRQSGLVTQVESRIIFDEKYRTPDAVRGLEEFSHLWLIWVFSEGFASKSKSENNNRPFSPTVRPPRLGGNERMGVWATRSPNRPNPIGLSCVEIVSVEPDTPEGPVITVRGADLMDGTPILDIKPYIAYADAHPDAECSYASEAPDMNTLSVSGTELIPDDMEKEAIIAVLSGDPRPSYQKDDSREYGIHYGTKNIRFTVSEDTVTVTDVKYTQD